jgi:hypothetical protein
VFQEEPALHSSPDVVFRFYTVTPDYSMQIKPEVPVKTGTRRPFSLPRFPPANILLA